jgi:alanine dehydrogenase
MIIGVPKEIKNHEYRVGLVPRGVQSLTERGHKVLIETNAGAGIEVTDALYRSVGATILKTAADVYEQAEMIVKVKEPLSQEYSLLHMGQVVFTFFHFASNQGLFDAMRKAGVVAIAYETIEGRNGTLPCLTPMSEVAGRMSIQQGTRCLERSMRGRGMLLGGVPGVPPAEVLVIGGGTVGTNAAKIAAGLGARVTIMDVNLERLRYLDDIMPKNVITMACSVYAIKERLPLTDLVVGAVLVVGTRAPVLITKDMLGLLKPGSVLVDVSIDQGGCFETSKPTTHENPTYVVDGIVHYCVANMPGTVSHTSTFALTNATLPYVMEISDLGLKKALKQNEGLKKGLNIFEGKVTLEPIASFFGTPYVEPDAVLK